MSTQDKTYQSIGVNLRSANTGLGDLLKQLTVRPSPRVLGQRGDLVPGENR